MNQLLFENRNVTLYNLMQSKIDYLHSIKRIRKIYRTGEEPVEVLCSDLNTYVCKYMRSSSGSYKLSCELIGGLIARLIGIVTPNIAFIQIRPEDWHHAGTINFSAPAIGSQFLSETTDITSITYNILKQNETEVIDLLKIALFDLWIGNEDRNYNNANLIYDIKNQRIVAIDHGCIFNTATFDYELTLLTSNESILNSDLASYLFQGYNIEKIQKLKNEVIDAFHRSLIYYPNQIGKILSLIPDAWNISLERIQQKLLELKDEEWIKRVIDAFDETIKDMKVWEN